MAVIVDTSVLSLAFRRNPNHLGGPDSLTVEEFGNLGDSGEVVILGVVRQEVLSGLRSAEQFADLRARLRRFDDPEVFLKDYEAAARAANVCRSASVASTATDMLICAVSSRMNAPVFTLDQDFERYARVLPLRLHRA